MYGNVSCLVLISFSVIRIFLIYFFVYDISKEFDLKAHETLPQENETRQRSLFQTLKKTFGYDATFLLVQQFYTGFYISLISRLFPFVVESLHYKNFVLDLCFIGMSVTSIVVSLIARKVNLSSRGIYYIGIMNLTFLLLQKIILVILPKGFNDAVNYVLLTALVLCCATCFIAY